jgi:hypothetical protein
LNQDDLTAARIIRRIRHANPSIGKAAAREMTAELFDLIACVQKRCSARPKPYPEFEVNNLIEAMMRDVVDDQPSVDAAAREAAESENDWIADWLMYFSKDNLEDLYLRYLRLSDRINGTDIVGECGLEEPPAKKPGLSVVRNDLPQLETLKQVVVEAVKQAQKGSGSRKILELLPEFKKSAGIDFVMHATEAHRAALYDLVRQPGIPVD